MKGRMIMDKDFALKFADEWISAWNAHDIERVLVHYDDDFEMNSPKIIKIAGELSGKLKGKAAVRAYWIKALGMMPNLQFELITVLTCIDSVAIYYYGAGRQLAVEVFHFGSNGKVLKAYAHYA